VVSLFLQGSVTWEFLRENLYSMTRCVGVSVSINGSPQVLIAVLGGFRSSPEIIELFKLTTRDVDLVDQLSDLAQAFGNRIAGLSVQRVSIRRADMPPKSSNKEGPKTRLMVEGALATTARSHVSDTRLTSGRDLALQAGKGKTKAEIDAEAASWVDNRAYVEAVAAALALLPNQ
jgi:hypothetical protein